MTRVILDPAGRLVAFQAIPPAFERDAAPSAPPDGADLLACAGLSLDTMATAEPILPRRADVETQQAWQGFHPDDPQFALQVEAAWMHGRPVRFAVLERLSKVDAQFRDQLAFRASVARHTNMLLLFALAVTALPLARINLRGGRGDIRGALRLAALVMAIRMVIWLLRSKHAVTLDGELMFLAVACLRALGEAALVWLFYIALEPYVRRFWPQPVIAWNRLLAGRFRDPLIGRSVLLGSLLGVVWVLIGKLDRLATELLQLPLRAALYFPERLAALHGPRHAMVACIDSLRYGIYQGLFFVLLIALLRVLLRRPWLAFVVAVLIISPMYIPRGGHPAVSWLTIGLAGIALSVGVTFRYGMLALMTAFFVNAVLTRFPLTLDRSVWYADLSSFALAIAAAVGLYGYLASRTRGHPAA
jgi:hypothetical protein